MGQVSCEIEILAPPAVVYELAKASEDFSRFMPDVRRVTVTERGDNYKVANWEANNDGVILDWTERDDYDDSNLVITFAQLPGGVFAIYEGRWEFHRTENGGTRTILTVKNDFGMPELDDLMGPTLDAKVEENANKMLAALKAEAEKQFVGKSSDL